MEAQAVRRDKDGIPPIDAEDAAMPTRIVLPHLDAVLAAALLLLSETARRLARPGPATAVLDEDAMPDWQKRDLGLLDGRGPSRGACR
jgi:hypothetical protein